MPDVKISALPEATSISSTDVAPVVTGGITKKASAATIVKAVLPAPGAIGSTIPDTGAFTTLTATNAAGVQNVSSSNVTYQAIGSSVTESVSDKLHKYIALTDFGAVGNGTTDDTTAWNTFFSYAGVKYIPPGNYLVSGTVYSYPNGCFVTNNVNTYDFESNFAGIDNCAIRLGQAFVDGDLYKPQLRTSASVNNLGPISGGLSVNVGVYAEHEQNGGDATNDAYTQSITGFALNNAAGDNDVIGVAGRCRKNDVVNGVGDSAGVWGSAYQYSTKNGGVMATESSIYQNVAGNTAADRIGSRWSISHHVNSDSIGSAATAGIAMDSSGETVGKYGYWNGIIIDKNTFAQNGSGAGISGTVGVNLGSWDSSFYPEYGIKIGNAGTHIYRGDAAFSVNTNQLQIVNTAVSTAAVGVQLKTAGSGNTYIDFYNGTNNNASVFWSQTNTNFVIGTNVSSPVAFKTNNTERATFTTAGEFVINSSIATSDSTATGVFQLHATSNFKDARASLNDWENNTNSGSVIFTKSRGGSVNTYSIVNSDDNLGALSFEGADGSSMVRAASITSYVDGSPTVNSMPGRIVFSTTRSGATSPTEAVRIDSLQRVGIGAVDTRAMLNIGQNNATVSGIEYYRAGGTFPSTATSYVIPFHQEVSSPASATTFSFLGSFKSQPATTGANSVITALGHFTATGPSTGAGSSISAQYGFVAENNLTSAVNNYGFYSSIASTTGRYNFYAAGNADNYFAGKLLIGGLTPVSGAVTYVVDSGLGRDSAYESNTANTLGFRQTFYKSRGSTSAKTIVSSGDEIGLINFYGYDGSAYVQAAAIRAYVDTTPGASDMPGRLSFFTTLDGTTTLSERLRIDNAGNTLNISSGGLGYGTGSGGAVTQTVSRTSGVTLNKTNGAITLVSAAGSASYQSFTVTNSTVAATDTIIINQKSGTDIYEVFITAVAAGSFRVTFATTGGTTTEQPVFNYAVIKAVTA